MGEMGKFHDQKGRSEALAYVHKGRVVRGRREVTVGFRTADGRALPSAGLCRGTVAGASATSS